MRPPSLANPAGVFALALFGVAHGVSWDAELIIAALDLL
jgi:hypothetical protein